MPERLLTKPKVVTLRSEASNDVAIYTNGDSHAQFPVSLGITESARHINDHFWDNTRLLSRDDVDRPNAGGRFDPARSVTDTIVVAEPTDRISLPAEPQESIKSAVSTNDLHLQIVRDRQEEFDCVVGYQRKTEEMLAYDPVFDRVNFELAADGEKDTVQSDIEKELITALRERYHTPLSVVKYVVKEGNIYSEDDFSEPVDIKFQRGALYRIRQGSIEPEREEQTVKAGIEAKRKLASPDTPLHSKAIIISPPGEVKDSSYQDNFVNIFEADEDPVTGERIIKMYLFACSLNTDEYRTVITKLQPDFFIGKKGSFDVQCLDPIFIDSKDDIRKAEELFNQEFRPQKDTTSEKDFQEILTRSFSLRQHYIDVICGKVFNPGEIAQAFNAFLNKADAIRREIISRGKGIINRVGEFGKSMVKVFRSAKDEVEWWGRQVVEKVMAGCGLSGGFSFGSLSTGEIISSAGSLVSRITGGLFGGSSKDKDYCIRCGACGEVIRCVVRKGERCPRSSCGAVRRC